MARSIRTVSPEPSAYRTSHWMAWPLTCSSRRLFSQSPHFIPQRLRRFEFHANSHPTSFLSLLSASSDHVRLLDATRKQEVTHIAAPDDRHCLRLGVIVRIKSGYRICLDSPKQEQAPGTQTIFPSPSSSSFVSKLVARHSDSRIVANMCRSARASCRADCAHLHLSLCHQARCPLWSIRVSSALLCGHPYLCFLPRRGMHGHVLGWSL